MLYQDTNTDCFMYFFISQIQIIPFWIFILIAVSVAIDIPYCLNFEKKQSKETNDYWNQKDNVNSFERSALTESYAKDSRIFDKNNFLFSKIKELINSLDLFFKNRNKESTKKNIIELIISIGKYALFIYAINK